MALLALASAALAFAPSRMAVQPQGRPLARACAPAMDLPLVAGQLHDAVQHNVFEPIATSFQLSGFLGMPSYSDEQMYTSTTNLDGKGGDLAVQAFLLVVFPVAVTAFFVGNFEDPE